MSMPGRGERPWRRGSVSWQVAALGLLGLVIACLLAESLSELRARPRDLSPVNAQPSAGVNAASTRRASVPVERSSPARGAAPPSASPLPIVGNVESRTGLPIAGASVCLVNTASGLDDLPSASCTLTDGRGRFTLPRITSPELLATAPGHLPARALGGDSGSAEVRITLEPGGAPVSGTVLDAGGGPIPGARVTVRRSPRGAVLAIAYSDVAGRFSATAVPGPVMLEATAEHYSVAHRLVEAPAPNLTLALVPASRIRGRVVRADGSPISDVAVTATVQAGAAVLPRPASSC